uniref:Uncharacterized protein LOC100183321 n=1 Tax=Phallusia mammillata TaxID=59560 RepID=A0A6F9DIK9_9ASCI|nr:uncharacterized protein LOC100183321 [Phallusia mammillata]
MDEHAKRKEDIYWKAFVGFVSPQKRVDTPVYRQRSFEYMELSDKACKQSLDSNSQDDCVPNYDSINAKNSTEEIVKDKSEQRCLIQTVTSLIGNCDLNTSPEEDNQISKNNNNSLDFREEQCTFECQNKTTFCETKRESRILSTSSVESTENENEHNEDLTETFTKHKENLQTDKNSNDLLSDDEKSKPTDPVAPAELQPMKGDELFLGDDSLEGSDFPQFVPTLSVIAEEDEGESPRRSLSVAPQHHSSANCLDDEIHLSEKHELPGNDDIMSARSFGSLVRRSSTLENLSLEECDEMTWQTHDFRAHLKSHKTEEESKSVTSSLVDEDRRPRCSSTEMRDVEVEDQKIEESSLSNHSSLVDSAYSSHEKLNTLSRSTPDLLCDSMEDLQYIPISYADTSLKRKKRRWPTFGVGDSRESLHAKVSGSGSSKFGSLRKRLTRKLSKRGQRPKRDSPDCDRIKQERNTASTLPRSSSIRRTIMRVFKFRGPENEAYMGEGRPRSWSLPTRNRHTTAVVMETEDSDVVVSELAII